jgi:hypothetical protein
LAFVSVGRSGNVGRPASIVCFHRSIRRRLRHHRAHWERERKEREAKRAEQYRIAAKRRAELKRLAAQQAKEQPTSESDERWGAIFAAQEFAKRGLTHPSTASFPWSAPSASKNGDGTWFVSGTVKAKNSFNLETTLRYSCRVKHVGTDWTLIDQQMSESGD